MLIRIGTRQSPLARWQADFVAGLLRSLNVDVELVPIVTAGDVSTTPLGQSGGVGLFTKEIQRALLDRRCDVAVHSLKDLPTEVIEGLKLAAVPPREDYRDCLIGRHGERFDQLTTGARVGTGSLRRAAQLRSLRPDIQILDIRGNVDSRLNKLDDGQYDAILLAAAGLKRLELDHRATQFFSQEEMLPAVGQAALGLETRADDLATINVVQQISHGPTFDAVLAERAMLRALRGGCLAPIAALAEVVGGCRGDGTSSVVGDLADGTWNVPATLVLRTRVLAVDGRRRIETVVAGRIEQAESIGLQAAKLLEIGGAKELINDSRGLSI